MDAIASGLPWLPVISFPVNLVGTIEMPLGAGKALQYDWHLGKSDFAHEPATKFADPQPLVNATRRTSFRRPGKWRQLANL